jgi:hypothetical protein
VLKETGKVSLSAGGVASLLSENGGRGGHFWSVQPWQLLGFTWTWFDCLRVVVKFSQFIFGQSSSVWLLGPLAYKTTWRAFGKFPMAQLVIRPDVKEQSSLQSQGNQNRITFQEISESISELGFQPHSPCLSEYTGEHVGLTFS